LWRFGLSLWDLIHGVFWGLMAAAQRWLARSRDRKVAIISATE
jgi:hypothetical protein